MDGPLLLGLDRKKEFNNWLMVQRVLLSYGCTLQGVAEHERRLRVPRGDSRG